MGKFWLKPKNLFQRIWPVVEILHVCLSDTFAFFSPPLGPWWSNFHKLHAAYIGFVSSTIWFQSWVSSSIRLEVMKGQKNCWILPFSHLLHLEHGQNKEAMAFRQCHIVEYLISTSHLVVGDPQGSLGAPQSLKTANKCYKSSDITLSTFQMSNTLFSHCEIIT